MADMLSQDEINALLGGSLISEPERIQLLTDEDKDALGEIGNISMGTAATTLFTLLGQKVTITTPKVKETNFNEIASQTVDRVVTIVINYRMGIDGLNLLVINERDVKIITDLMMGGDGTNVSEELTDLHLSAISEAMNQMIGSSSTSLSEMLGHKIDISPPEAFYDTLDKFDVGAYNIPPDSNIVSVSFRITIGDLIDSEIMQIMHVEWAQAMVERLLGKSAQVSAAVAPPVSKPAPQAAPAPVEQAVSRSAPAEYQEYYEPAPNRQSPPVNAQPLQFNNFDEAAGFGNYHSDIGLIRDVPLEISVELGRTVKRISEILDFSPGTVVELDKLVGESLDINANGKLIAKGEVVVVDENYGIRITEIVMPDRRLKK